MSEHDSLGVGRISAAERVAEAASAWLGPEPFELRDRRNAGESHIGLMASDEWKVLIEAVAVWKDAE